MLAFVLMILILAKDYRPQARYFPWMIGAVTAILLIWEIVVKSRKETEQEEKIDKEHKHTGDVVYKRWLTMAISLIIYVAVMRKIGFNVSTFIFLLMIYWSFDVKPYYKNIFLSLVITGAFFIVFDMLLGIRLPSGIWF